MTGARMCFPHIGIESKEGVGTVVTLQFPRKHRCVRMMAEGSDALEVQPGMVLRVAEGLYAPTR